MGRVVAQSNNVLLPDNLPIFLPESNVNFGRGEGIYSRKIFGKRKRIVIVFSRRLEENRS